MEAFDELRRELEMRDKYYPNWVADGRLARSDARDRYDRLKSAIQYLEAGYQAELVNRPSKDGLPF